MDIIEDIAADLEEWVPVLDAFAANQKAIEEAAFMDLVDIIADSVFVDGDSLRDSYGNPSDWYWAKNPRNAKSVR